MTGKKREEQGIAVVGMACWYPGAQSLAEFWENILAKRQQFRRMPEERLPHDAYHSPDKNAADKTYGTEAAVVDGYDFDWKEKRIPKKTVECTDIAQWMALDVALKALEDSNLALEKLQKINTGVILGNTLTGEWTRTNAMRMRWPYFEKVLRETAKAQGIGGPALEAYIQAVEPTFKSVFPPVTEDTLAGALSNTIAGRVCNFLDLHGGGYTVDGACSSSLIAVITAARNLAAGELDVAFAGGIDISLDTFELIGFAKTGALTADEMRVYDKRANGFIPGEGCGFVIMKRLEDAVRDGDRIYAVVKGWGLSSDGRGGLTAPSIAGQANAISKAYKMAGYHLKDCAFIEGHGTGTTVGDKIEVSALVEVLGDETPKQHIGLTSLKSIVGHTKAAAGIGAFIKAVIAVNQRVVPPMAGVEEFNDLFSGKAKHFLPLVEGQKHAEDSLMRAGLSAMGFGGINSHVTLQSFAEPAPNLRPSSSEEVLLSSHDRGEVLVFSAASQSALERKISQTLGYVRRIARAELSDLAADLARFVKGHEPYRAAVVVQRPEEAFHALSKLHKWLETPLKHNESRESIEGSSVLALGHSTKAPRIAFVFPGQGAQKLNMAKKLSKRYDWAKERLSRVEDIFQDVTGESLEKTLFTDSLRPDEELQKKLSLTEIAQPAITLANVLWFEAMQRFGISPSVVAGHSLGELSALYAAKAFDLPTLIKLATQRGALMANRADRPGGMIHLACDQATAESLIKAVDGYVAVANINAADQTILSGDVKALEKILELAKAKSIRSGALPVSNAFHSDYMREAAVSFKSFMETKNFKLKAPELKFYRGTDGQLFDKSTDLSSYLSQQMTDPVNFVALARALEPEADLIFEVGPASILSGLFKRISPKAGPTVCWATESRPGQDADYKAVLAISFIRGVQVRWDELYRARFVRPFVRPDEKKFIESPTERPLTVASVAVPAQGLGAGWLPAQPAAQLQQPLIAPVMPIHAAPLPLVAPVPAQVAPAPAAVTTSVEQVLFGIIESLTGFEAATLKAEMRVLDDLNLDSIKASELVANATMHYGIAGELEFAAFANASITEIAQAIRDKLAEKGLSTEPARAAASGALEASTLPSAAASVSPLLSPAHSAYPAPQPLAERASPAREATAKPKASAASSSLIAETSKAKNKTPWVRNFTEVFREEMLIPSSSWKGAEVHIIASARDVERAKSIGESLGREGAVVRSSILPAATSETFQVQALDCELALILLPSHAAQGFAEALSERVRILSAVAQGRWKRGQTLSFIQFDDGRFGQSSSAAQITSAKAFAQSLALERSDLNVRALSFADATDLAWLGEVLFSTWKEEGAMRVSAFDLKGIRRVPELVPDEPHRYKPRAISWQAEDVIVVSGGAKGITAACALAFAKEYKVKMALIGSSPLSATDAKNPEHPVTATLEQYRAAQLEARYYSCDISEASEVSEVMRRIRSEMGPISGLVHGAGINKPRPAATVDAPSALAEMAPKVNGMWNLLLASTVDPIKLVVGLTSVIGVSGMPGNAWYGFANETLDLMIRRYRDAHPEVHTQTLAYSVWAEVGMGARMGSDKNLESKGIGSIAPEEGIQRFMDLIQKQSLDQQTVISSRLGEIGQRLRSLPSQNFVVPFVEQMLHFQRDVEAIVRTKLTLESHSYLKDHNYKGAYLMPTVYGLEAMAQVVNTLYDLSADESCTLENIQLSRPITVGNQGVDIEIYAEVMEKREPGASLRVKAGIRTALTGFKNDHFAAEFVLKASEPRDVVGVPAFGDRLQIEPMQQLYGSILFQGPMFQRIKDIYHLESDNETEGRTVFHSQADRQHLSGHLLGDPFFRDSLLQSAQIIIPQNQCLPIEIERLILFRGHRGVDQRLCFTDVYKADAKTYLATIDVFDTSGRLVERMENYRLQFLEKRPQLPKAMDLIEAGTATRREVTVVEAGSENPLLTPYRSTARLLRIDAEPNGPQDQSVFVHRFIPDFKTFANLNRSIYFAHFFNWMGLSREMSSIPVLDKIRELTETGRWGLVTNWSSIEVLGECRNRERIVEARMWCGKITGSKNSSATLNFDWVSRGPDQIEERIAIGQMGFTWVEIMDHGIVRPAEFPEYYQDFIASMVAKNDKKDSYVPAPEPYRDLEKGSSLFVAPQGPSSSVPLAEKIYQTGLFDANLVGNLYFGNYSIWMGKLRDEFFQGIVPHLYRGIGEEGELTCVKARIQHLREAMPFDDIRVTMAVRAIHSQGLDLYFEFFKVNPHGAPEKLAIGEHSAIWAKDDASGKKVGVPLPSQIVEVLLGAVERHLTKSVVKTPAS